MIFLLPFLFSLSGYVHTGNLSDLCSGPPGWCLPPGSNFTAKQAAVTDAFAMHALDCKEHHQKNCGEAFAILRNGTIAHCNAENVTICLDLK